ncbi:MAG: TatD family hydrolase [Fibrobacterota bacterium]
MDALIDIHTHDNAGSHTATRLVCIPPEDIGRASGDTSDKFCSGIHPWDCASPSSPLRFERISACARLGEIRAVGESGLDRFRRDVDFSTQLRWFRMHIDLSEATGIPLVVHSVRTDSDILSEHSRAAPRAPWILHACAAEPDLLEQFLSRGLFVSFGPRELSRPNSAARLAVAFGPRFFLETDDSATPIQEVYAQAARLLGISVAEIAVVTRSNWRRLFGE